MAGAIFVVAIGSPSLEDKYDKVTFSRDVDKQKVTYTADEMLTNRLVFITPAEAFKAKYNQAMNPVYLDVRSEADYNLYHIEDAVNIPIDSLTEVIPVLLTEPAANSVFIVMSNDETAAVEAWKTLVASSVPNTYILEGGVNSWIAFFGADERALQPTPQAGDDELKYIFPAALGDRYESCSPSPIKYEDLEFEAKIKLELKRDKSGGGCG
jgi:rhodanese-related sulfurtransferase